jgi:hypothetical protein
MKDKKKLRADLESNYYLFNLVKDKSKLELIDLIRGRDDRLNKYHRDSYISDDVTITVKKGSEIIQEIKISPKMGDDWLEYPKEAVFDIANKLHWIYGDGEIEGIEVSVNFKL